MSANDNGDRRRIFQTPGGAMSEALRSACRLSPSGQARPSLFVPNVYQPKEGGQAFEAENLIEGWAVREIPAAELARRIEGGMRQEIERLYKASRRHERLAEQAEERGDDTFVRTHMRYRADFIDMARTLEEQLTARAV